jgi:hypothetical protein
VCCRTRARRVVWTPVSDRSSTHHGRLTLTLTAGGVDSVEESVESTQLYPVLPPYDGGDESTAACVPQSTTPASAHPDSSSPHRLPPSLLHRSSRPWAVVGTCELVLTLASFCFLFFGRILPPSAGLPPISPSLPRHGRDSTSSVTCAAPATVIDCNQRPSACQ